MNHKPVTVLTYYYMLSGSTQWWLAATTVVLQQDKHSNVFRLIVRIMISKWIELLLPQTSPEKLQRRGKEHHKSSQVTLYGRSQHVFFGSKTSSSIPERGGFRRGLRGSSRNSSRVSISTQIGARLLLRDTTVSCIRRSSIIYHYQLGVTSLSKAQRTESSEQL